MSITTYSGIGPCSAWPALLVSVGAPRPRRRRPPAPGPSAHAMHRMSFGQSASQFRCEVHAVGGIEVLRVAVAVVQCTMKDVGTERHSCVEKAASLGHVAAL